MQVQTKYHAVHDDVNDTIIIKERFVDYLRKIKVDEKRINSITSILDGNASKESIIDGERG